MSNIHCPFCHTESCVSLEEVIANWADTLYDAYEGNNTEEDEFVFWCKTCQKHIICSNKTGKARKV